MILLTLVFIIISSALVMQYVLIPVVWVAMLIGSKIIDSKDKKRKG